MDKPLEIEGVGELGEVVVQQKSDHTLLFQTKAGIMRNLTLRQLGGGRWLGVHIAQGRLTLEGCDISNQCFYCVLIHRGAMPILRRNRIHDGKAFGVFVYEQGAGLLEENEIFGNANAGVAITEGSRPTLRRNHIHHNGGVAVLVFDGAQGTFEENDLRDNEGGAWEIVDDCLPNVTRRGNIE